MNNAKQYEPKMLKLLKSAKKSASIETVESAAALPVMVRAILQADVSEKQFAKAIAAVEKEYVDFNELRVSQTKEIVECIGEDYPDSRGKAVEIVRSLNNLFDKVGKLSLVPLEEMNKRDVRKLLKEIGLGNYAEGYVSMVVFGIHAIPVDEMLAGLLETQELVPAGCDLHEIQAFLERIVKQKDGVATHMFLQSYIDDNRKLASKGYNDRYDRLLAKRKAEAERLAREAEERRKAEETAIDADFEIDEPLDDEVVIIDEEIDEEVVDIEIETEVEVVLDKGKPQQTPAEESKPAAKPAAKSKAKPKPAAKKTKPAAKTSAKPAAKTKKPVKSNKAKKK